MDILKKFAEQRQKKAAAKVTVNYEVMDGPCKLVLSTTGDIEAYHNGKRYAWNPSITNDQYTLISNGDGNEVAAQLIDGFRREIEAASSTPTRLAEWKENHEYEKVWEDQVESKRTGEPGLDVKEHQLADKADRYKRTNPDGMKTREEELAGDYFSKREDGDHTKVREEMLKDDAGLYGQRGTDDDVREHLLADARKGMPEEVIENQLEHVRKDYGPGTPNLTAKAAIEALGKTVVSARVTPEEVIELARKFAGREDFADLIKLASLGTKARDKANARKAFHNLDQETRLEADLFDQLGRAVTSEVFAADLARTLKVATVEETNTVKSVTRIARSLMGDSDNMPSSVKYNASYEDKVRAALASEAEDENHMTKEHARAAIESYANTVRDLQVTPMEVLAAINNGTSESLIGEIELARTASATEARLIERDRNEFWGKTRTASKKNIRETAVGWLADYCQTYNYPTTSVALAALRVASAKDLGEKIIAKLVKAAVTVTDEQTSTKRIMCRVDDLGGIDPKSETFNEEFRSKAIEILASSGYHVDPSTFNLSDVSVTENGDITASVTTRFSKSFKADGSAAPTEAGASGNGIGLISTQEVESPTPDVPATIMTASAIKARKARREALVREAQMAPPAPGGAGAPPMGTGGMGTPMGTDAGLGNPADGAGMSALTGDPGANAPGDDTDTDDMSNPGEKQPWGTVCPQCGSTSVDVAAGEGQCNDCGAMIEYSMIAKVKTDGGKGEGGKKDESPLESDDQAAGANALAEGGLGAATAPAPGPEAGAGAAPMMMAASYYTTPDVFVRFAQGATSRKMAGVALPIGEICPQCGNREAKKVNNSTFCRECATWSNSYIDIEEDGRVKSTIEWLIS